MQTVYVESKAIASLSFDKDATVLTVSFHDGKSHAYPNVSADTFAALVAAPSVGAYFNRFIRNRRA